MVGASFKLVPSHSKNTNKILAISDYVVLLAAAIKYKLQFCSKPTLAQSLNIFYIYSSK